MRYDGATAPALAERCGVPQVVVLPTTPSTMDEAHALAARGAAAGTIVLADAQTAGRGRAGRRWASEPGLGIWLSLIERPRDARALDVLSLRLGLFAARELDRFAGTRLRLKWPNDIYAGDRKLAGILVEARWRDGQPEWVTIGFGLNVSPPASVPEAAGLLAGTERLEVLAALVPALRLAAAATGFLTVDELEAFASRDLAVGRACTAPLAGTVDGITADGALRVMTAAGPSTARGGSLLLAGVGE
jgi:BirA family transcriptional regulator, biotin operon repressor / biotin---[acetyl-CoA-carboxylase] ligase